MNIALALPFLLPRRTALPARGLSTPKRRSRSKRRVVRSRVLRAHLTFFHGQRFSRPPVRPTVPVFTDIGTVGNARRSHSSDVGELRTLAAPAKAIPVVGTVIAEALNIAASIGDALGSVFSAGNAAGLSPQQLDAISAGIKRGGVGSTGSVLNRVEGRAGTKQLFDPDEPGGYRTVGGRFMDGG